MATARRDQKHYKTYEDMYKDFLGGVPFPYIKQEPTLRPPSLPENWRDRLLSVLDSIALAVEQTQKRAGRFIRDRRP